MNTVADLEIAALHRAEARQSAESVEADRLVQQLLAHYACDFVVAVIPDGGWVALPEGWQSGLDKPVEMHRGDPPRDRKGAVGVSLETLRNLARRLT